MFLKRIVEALWTSVGLRIVAPRGADIGRDVWISPSAKLDWEFGIHITVRDGATIVDGARILCHDASSMRRIGATRVSPVLIGEKAYIGADSIVLPGVTIGANAVVAAGSVVANDVEEGTVVAGVPARTIGRVSDLDGKRLQEMKSKPVFNDAMRRSWGFLGSRYDKYRKAIDESGCYYVLANRDDSPSTKDRPRR